MRILVDADACPVKGIIVALAKERALSVILVADQSHVLDDGYSEVCLVDKGRDSADLKLCNLLSPGDLVVTQDYGVAAMALAKNAKALNQNGLVYKEDNLDGLLFQRHVSAKLRRAGGRTNGPPKRTRADDEAFKKAFLCLLNECPSV